MGLKVTGTRQLFTAPKGEKGDKGEDGNSFTPKGQAYGHFSSYQDWETAISNGQIQTAVPYLVDNTGYEHALVCYKYGHGNGSGTSEDGDAWTIISTKHLWAAVGDRWVDFGEIQGPPGENGQDGEDGKDAELYQLLMTEAWARWEYNSSNDEWVLKCCIKGEAWFIKGENRVSASSGLNYENQRIRIRYNNGKEIHFANIAGDGTWVDGYEGAYMQDDVYGESRVGQPKSIIVDLIGKDISDQTTVLDSKTIAIVWDGEPGAKGGDGDPGPMGIPAGAYSSSARYERTKSIVPIVEHNGEYWYPKNIGVLTNSEPSANNTNWKKAENFEVMFVKILFAAFAKLGEAIFHGNFMFSQNGKVNGAASNNYQMFTPSDPDNEANASRFAPNLYLNFLTGAARLAAGKAKFFADGSGSLAGGNIEWTPQGTTTVKGQIITTGQGFETKILPGSVEFKSLLQPLSHILIGIDSVTGDMTFVMTDRYGNKKWDLGGQVASGGGDFTLLSLIDTYANPSSPAITLENFFNKATGYAYAYNGMWKMIGATKVFEDGQENYDNHYYHGNGVSIDPNTLIKTPTGNALSDGWYKTYADLFNAYVAFRWFAYQVGLDSTSLYTVSVRVFRLSGGGIVEEGYVAITSTARALYNYWDQGGGRTTWHDPYWDDPDEIAM